MMIACRSTKVVLGKVQDTFWPSTSAMNRVIGDNFHRPCFLPYNLISWLSAPWPHSPTTARAHTMRRCSSLMCIDVVNIVQFFYLAARSQPLNILLASTAYASLRSLMPS